MSDQSERKAPAGWYEFDDGERYWDGERWTDEYRAIQSSGPQPMASDSGGPQPVATSGSGPQPVATGPVATGADNGGTIEYKVLTQKDRYFAGKFDPEKLEAALNSYAKQGWRVSGVATADIRSFGGSRQELVVVMSRS
jgi:hypothetical protein